MKKFIFVVLVAFLTVGCSHVQGALEKVLPTIEAKAGGEGIGLSISSNLGVDVFCFEEDGTAAGILNKIPVLGGVIIEAVGKCETEEEATPEVVE